MSDRVQNTGTIKLPVVDPAQRLTRQTIKDLPLYLDNEDDRQVAAALLEVAWRAALPGTTTVGTLAEMLEESDVETRRILLEGAEALSGVAEKRAERQRQAIEQANRLKVARGGGRLVFDPRRNSWVDVDEEEAEAARQQAELASRQARREAEQQERRLEAEQRAAYERARDEQARRELPEHLR